MIFKRKLLNLFCGVILGSTLSLPLLLQAQKKSEPTAAADTAVNSKYNEFKPMLSPDGKRLYFTRSNHPLNSGGRRAKGVVWIADALPDGSLRTAQRADNTFTGSQLNMVVGFSTNGQ